ncbi:MAG: hypothetical protein P4N59_24055 [Negativicutes bacterium]|nr:hypothetical protein [Negativicutes bacterium]
MMDDLKGTPVLVHPGLSYDPAGKQNQVGLISKADLMNDDVFVSFNGELALYPAEALFVLLPAEEIHQNLTDIAYETPFAELKPLTQIDLFLRYGSAGKELTAMHLAHDNPAIRPLCLDTLQNQLIKSIDQNLSR